jgi:UDP-GlcNAc:undecaprenyl-phosphate/decaprenyl-phosphate GlcNAc-1-phosphate transferase
MENYYLELIVGIVLMVIQLPLFIKLFHKLKLLDQPDERKAHKKAIPAIGGVVIGLTMIELTILFKSFSDFWIDNFAIGIPCLVLMVTGFLDDQRNLSSGIRFLIQFGCSLFLVYNGISINNLGGILGFAELPFWFDAGLTILTVAGITNAFNLIDGIDGLAGGIAFSNLTVFALIAYLSGYTGFFIVSLSWATLILVFLFFNWSPAKVFMGDGGSLVLGFFFIAMGLSLREEQMVNSWLNASSSIAILGALLIVPVTDTLRVFAFRISQGRSPYSADRNHLHHWIIRNRMSHKIATMRILLLHLCILPITIVMINFKISLVGILLIQFAIVLIYTKLIQAITNFNRWYRFIRLYEMNDAGL